ncbi:MAG: hypothetical protein AAFY37_14170 [Pseudomonadota bacterium]
MTTLDAPPAAAKRPGNLSLAHRGGIAALLIGVIHALYGLTPTAWEWTTMQDIPYILRRLDPTFNPHDFYTNAVVDTPRFGVYWLTRGFALFGIDWPGALYAVKVSTAIIRPALIFFVIALAAERMADRTGNMAALPYTYAGALVFILAFILWPVWWMPMGWVSAFVMEPVSASQIAATLGLGLTCMILHTPHRRLWLKAVLLAATTALHPAIGLALWAWTAPVWLYASSTWRAGALRAMTCLVPALGVAAALAVTYAEPETLSAEAFREIYVRWRHPFHYDLAYIFEFGRGQIISIVLLAGLWILSLRTQRQDTILLTTGFVGVSVGAVALHWIGVDVLASKAAMKLGATRFTSLAPVFVMMALAVVGVALSAKSEPFGAKGPKRSSTAAPAFAAAAALLTAIIAPLSFQPPLADTQSRDLVDWLSEHTEPSDVFIDMTLVPVANDRDGIHFHASDITQSVRVFAQRPVFADKGYTFTERTSEAFRERLQTNLALSRQPAETLLCNTNGYRADYALYMAGHPMMPEQAAPVLKTHRWSLFDLKRDLPCPSS